jgi:hypothetical protein
MNMKRNQYCDGIQRRDFMRVGGVAVGGLMGSGFSLASYLQLAAAGQVQDGYATSMEFAVISRRLRRAFLAFVFQSTCQSLPLILTSMPSFVAFRTRWQRIDWEASTSIPAAVHWPPWSTPGTVQSFVKSDLLQVTSRPLLPSPTEGSALVSWGFSMRP